MQSPECLSIRGESMTHKHAGFCSAIILLLLCAAGSRAHAAEPDTWESVRAIHAGQDVRVETADRKFRGSLLNVSQSEIVLETGAGEVTVERGDVARVFVGG